MNTQIIDEVYTNTRLNLRKLYTTSNFIEDLDLLGDFSPRTRLLNTIHLIKDNVKYFNNYTSYIIVSKNILKLLNTFRLQNHIDFDYLICDEKLPYYGVVIVYSNKSNINDITHYNFVKFRLKNFESNI